MDPIVDSEEEKAWMERLNAQIEVKEPEDLVKELTRLKDFLNDLTPPWQTRVGALQKFNILIGSPAVNFPNFISSLNILKSGIAAQIADRRSKVVKETCTTLTVLAKRVKSLSLTPEDSLQYIAIIKYWIEELYQTLVQTIKVTSEAGGAGMKEILENTNDDADHTLLRMLCAGASHKHASVRGRCLECISIMLVKFPTYCVPKVEDLDRIAQQLQSKDENVMSTAKETAAEEKSGVFQLLEDTIGQGLQDGNSDARAFARVSLIEFFGLSKPHAARLLNTMPASALKLFHKQFTEFIGTHHPVSALKLERPRIPLKDRIKASQKLEEQAGATTTQSS